MFHKNSLTIFTSIIPFLVLATLTLVLIGCGGAPTVRPLPSVTPSPPQSPTPTRTHTPTAIPPSPTYTSTPTPAPTDTAIPPTLTPTLEPEPSPTSTVVLTPTPTLIPEDAPTVTSAPAVSLTPIEAITTQRLGEVVSVEGTVVNVRSFSHGFAFTLDDGTGQIELLMWHNVYDDCWDAGKINLGATVRAAGEIGQYEGVLQIEPDFGGNVKVSAPAAPAPPWREIGSLSGGDEGQRVTIEGVVIRVEGRDSWAKIFIGDETGEIAVFMYRNVLDRVPKSTALGMPGSRVRVVGPVSVYRGNLEIAPALPYDVTVLSE